jgi:hypothetical protein
LAFASVVACAHAVDATDDSDRAASADAGARVDRGEAGTSGDADPGPSDAAVPDDGDATSSADTGADADAAIDAPVDASDGAPAVDAGLCGTATVLVHRGKDASGARVLTTTSVLPPGFTEETSFRVFPQPSGGDTKPLYQLFSPSFDDYLPSLGTTEGAPSYQLTGTLGHMYNAQQPGTMLLKRYVQASPQKHMASTNPSDVPAGFYDEGPMGYVCPP